MIKLPASTPPAARTDSDPEACLRFDRYVLDLRRGSLKNGEQDIVLRPKSFEVLRLLVENAGRLVGKDEIAAAVWPDVVVTDSSLTQCIKELRRALGNDGERLIKTVSRRGYRLESTAAAVAPTDALPTADTESRPAAEEPAATAKRRLRVVLGVIVASVLLALALFLSKLWDSATPLRPILDPAKPTVAVLPFSNLSGDPGQEYFSDGITEDLITDLSQISGLFVIARNSSFAYRNKTVGAAQIGRELGTRYIVEGSVQRSGGRLRINTQLTDASTGIEVWADRYDRDIKDLFAMQDDVRQKIVSALAVKLSPGESRRLARKQTGNVEAYNYWARGRENLAHMTAEENVEARRMFLRAIEIDPNFARAYGGIANTYSLEVELGWAKASFDEAIANSLTYAQRAVSLDEGLPEARWALARAYAWYRQPDRAIAEIEQAVKLNPSYADGQAYYALLLAYDGRAREGLHNIEQAMQINPQYPFWYRHNLGVIEFMLGQYARAAGHLKEALDRNPNWQPSRQMLVAAYGQLGRVNDAQWEIGELRTAGSDVSLARIRERAPFRAAADQARLLDGLRKAGVAE